MDDTTPPNSERTDALPDDWCYFHNVSEPWDPEAGDTCCGECFHAFKPNELVREWNKLADRLNLSIALTDADVRSCPFCAHDL